MEESTKNILASVVIITFFVMLVILPYILMSSNGIENYDTYIIDLYDTDYYDFSCNNSNVRFRTKDYLKDMTRQDILNRGGEQSDVKAMDLKLDEVTPGVGTMCNVTYSFKTPENGEWKTNLEPRVTKIKTVRYRTRNSPGGGYDSGYGSGSSYGGYGSPYGGYGSGYGSPYGSSYGGGYGYPTGGYRFPRTRGSGWGRHGRGWGHHGPGYRGLHRSWGWW